MIPISKTKQATLHVKIASNIALLLCLALLLPQIALAQFTGNSWSDFTSGATAVCANDATDIDEDNDGLIELCYLEDVDAIRHNLMGTSLKRGDSTLSNGCPSDGCKGYEFVRDLDFDDDLSYINLDNKDEWTTKTGWTMIPGSFSGTLEGNGHTLSNLYINVELGASERAGFMQSLTSTGRIRNLGLPQFDINVTLTSFNPIGAALVADTNQGKITNCYVQGELNFETKVGLIIAAFTSLVRNNQGTVSNSYVDTIANGGITGLFCRTNTGTISDSYAEGDLTSMIGLAANFSEQSFIDDNYGTIKNIYYAVDSEFGRPIVRDNHMGENNQPGGRINNSYWDETRLDTQQAFVNEFNNPTTIINTHGFPTDELQQPTTPSAVATAGVANNPVPYYQWSKANWDFGASDQYPAVKYARGGDADDPACDDSQQPACGTVLRGQRKPPKLIIEPIEDIRLLEKLSRELDVTITDAEGDPFSVRLDSSNDKVATATVVTTTGAGSTLKITAEGAGTAEITVTADDGQGTVVSATFSVKVEFNTRPDIDSITQTGALQVGGTAQLRVEVSSSGREADLGDTYTLTAESSDPAIVSVSPESFSGLGLSFEEDRSFTLSGHKNGEVTITITATDNVGLSNSKTVTVRVAKLAIVPIADIQLLDKLSTTLNVIVKDAAGDPFSVRVDSSDSTVATATFVATADAGRTLKITAEKVGTADITVTADDGQGEVVSETFNVEVVLNTVPRISNIIQNQGLQLGGTAQLEVQMSIRIIELNLGDRYTLRAESLDSGIVSISPAIISGLGGSLTRSFTLNGHTAGEATIKITATDNVGLRNSRLVPVRVNAPPVITITPDPSDLRVLEGTSKTLVVTATDANDDDSDFIVNVKSDNPTTATVSPVTASDAGYSFTIEARKEGTVPITVTVDDGRGVPNSEATETFNVEVVKNQAPTLRIVSTAAGSLEAGVDSTSIGISVRDANFDVGDSVTLEAVSSTPSVVFVVPESVSIDSNKTQFFSLLGTQVGESEITITATDRNGRSDTVSVLISVFSSLATGTVPTDPIIATRGKVYDPLDPLVDTSAFFTYSGAETLSYTTATVLPTGLSLDTETGVISGTLPNNTAASTNMDGLPVTVTAADGLGGSAEATFKLLINAEPSGSVTISPNDTNEWLLVADISDVEDDNGIDETMTSYQWSKGETVVSTTDSNTYTIPDDDSRRTGTEYKVDVKFVDNIKQSTTISSVVYTVANRAPVIDAINPATQTVEEDETVSITASASDANNDDLTYTWSVLSRDTNPSILEDAMETEDGQISFDVPADWVVDPSIATGVTETLRLQVTVSDGNMSVPPQTATVVVTKVDNDKVDTPSISVDSNNIDLFTLQIDLASDPDGENDDNSNLNYQWQRCLADADCSPQGDWMNIDGATNRSLTVPNDLRAVGNKFRVETTYTDKQNYRDSIFSSTRDYDTDPVVRVRAKVFLEGPLQ